MNNGIDDGVSDGTHDAIEGSTNDGSTADVTTGFILAAAATRIAPQSTRRPVVAMT